MSIDYDPIREAAEAQKPGSQFTWKGSTYVRVRVEVEYSPGWVCIETGVPVWHFSALVEDNGDNPWTGVAS